MKRMVLVLFRGCLGFLRCTGRELGQIVKMKRVGKERRKNGYSIMRSCRLEGFWFCSVLYHPLNILTQYF